MPKKLKANEIKKQIKSELSEIRNLYSKALKSKETLVFECWLCDNYYILEREGHECKRQLGYMKKKSSHEKYIGETYEVCLKICENGKLPQQKALIEKLSEQLLTTAQIEKLPLVLRCVLLHYAYLGCLQKSGNGTELLKNAVTSFRDILEIDFTELIEQLSPVEKILLKDPAGIYGKMDDKSRELYRYEISQIAEEKKISDEKIAYDALDKAEKGDDIRSSHIGTYLFRRNKNQRHGKAEIYTEVLLPAVVSAFLGVFFRIWYLPFILYFPIWEITKYIVEYFFQKRVSPHRLPKLDLSSIPDDALTLITISMLLPSAGQYKQLKKRLQNLWRSNGQKNIKICILADLKGADVPEKPEDRENIAAAKRVIEDLNNLYGGGFILAVRPRVYSKTQKMYTGWERKRGAITQLIRKIKTNSEDFTAFFGDTERCKDIKYLIALDSDTYMPMNAAHDLTSIALHPLNKAIIDYDKRVVKSGYGIIVPLVDVEINSTQATLFSKLMAGEGGISPYDNLASEKYFDMFDEGIFSGKGLIDVDVFYALLDDTLPEEQILSHDIIEGGYLRVGFASDIQVADGFPKRQTAFFDRLERWIRGDWQNIGFLLKKSHLNRLSKYKLFDNLRRSITPLFACLAIIVSVIIPQNIGYVVLFISIISIMYGELISAFRSIISGGTAMISRLYYSGALPVSLSALLRGFLNLVMLVQYAYTGFMSAARALYRLTISRKKLLEWTTAAQSDVAKSGYINLKRCLPTIIFSSALLLFGNAAHRLCALFFLLNIPFSIYSGKENRTEDYYLKSSQKDKLGSYAAALWSYYEDYCTAENNYLPPDNIQDTPVFRVANRTSPTNIGLMMLCTLVARDLGFLSSKQLHERLERTLTSVEKLEKWQGNLLNWYNTSNLKPLEPKYVSTVDSGNLLCSMVALKQGLLEYSGECGALENIRERLNALIEECKIQAFYNTRRNLFHIGYDLQNEELSKSYYDLLMSEARMTSYYSIANRDVPSKHWGYLGRTLAKEGRYTGPVSWTGTMFEYFMPYIFLPSPRGSLGYEALKFCLWCQQKRMSKAKIRGKVMPWGSSESGFFAFDRQLNYQYKAHGVQKLGLKRGLDDELVVSPYSSFLALPLQPKTAIKNLESFEKMDCMGRYGFYEALDFTAMRTAGQDYAAVRSYMAHHVGMSLLSVANVMFKNVIQNRFMSDERMASAACLLQEKIPTGASVFKDIEKHDIPKTHENIEPKSREFEIITPTAPHIHLLTNGEYTTAITDVGASFSTYRGVSILRHSDDLLRRPCGIFAFVRQGKRLMPVCTAPDYRLEAEFRAEFNENIVCHGSSAGGLSAEMTTLLHPRLPMEQRSFVVKNMSSREEKKCSLLIYMEPSLASHKETEAHPLFSKLFLLDELDNRNGILIFSRKPRNDGQAIFLAVGFLEDVKFICERSRERIMKCGEEMADIFKCEPAFTEERGNPDACAAFQVSFRLSPKEIKKVNLVLCVAGTRSEAVNMLVAQRVKGRIKESSGAPSPFLSGGLETVIADIVLPQLFYKMRETDESIDAIRKNTEKSTALWEFSISGDNPIMFIEINSETDIQRALPYIVLNRRLKYAGIITDLVIGYREGGEYNKPIMNAIRSVLKSNGCEDDLNTFGGIFAIDFLSFPAAKQIVTAAASYIAPSNGERFELLMLPYRPIKIMGLEPINNSIEEIKNVKHGYFTDEKYIIPNHKGKPIKPWTLPLCNQSFGTLVSDKSLGFTWAINSREGKLTPWHNDSRLDNRGELLFARINGTVYDIILNSSVEFSEHKAIWRGKACNLRFLVEVEVPEKGMIKICKVTIKNESDSKIALDMVYYIEPILGVGTENSRNIKSENKENGILLYSSYSSIFGYCLLSTDKADFICCDRADFWSGKWENERKLPLPDPCAAVGKSIEIGSGKTVVSTFCLSFGKKETAVEKLVKMTDRLLEKRSENSSLKIENIITQNDDIQKISENNMKYMTNSWLKTQIVGSRIFGRTGFYQCGGAYGFRDQLQDVSSLVMTKPELVRRHIIRCTAVQFLEGDVMHWWHRLPKKDGGLKGVRTRYSDDLLWLPFVTSEYVEKTGDRDILNISAPYLEAEELKNSEDERYFSPRMSSIKGTVYEHCIKAVERAARFGAHGLPLIGGGDWNDGFNKVGIEGKGESVWLAQFMSIVLKKTAVLCDIMNDLARAESYRNTAASLLKNVDESAYANGRYLRAFFDDGTALGSSGSKECTIDSLSQSFAVIADMPDKQRISDALDKAINELVDGENHIIKLLDPPFSGKFKKPGYIASYPEGIRENGGQYTHAAVWLCIALIKFARQNEGYELLKLINPAEICSNTRMSDIYRAEPDALAGDVSSASGIKGRAGWTQYTGAAAWYSRAVIEELLGLKMRDGNLYIDPHLPDVWKECSLTLRIRETNINLVIKNCKNGRLKAGNSEVDFIQLDGNEYEAVFDE